MKSRNVPMARCSISAAALGQSARQPRQRDSMVEKAVEHVTKLGGCGWRELGARFSWEPGTAIRVARLALHEGLLEGEIEALRPPAAHPDDCRCEACWAEGTPLPVDAVVPECCRCPRPAVHYGGDGAEFCERCWVDPEAWDGL